MTFLPLEIGHSLLVIGNSLHLKTQHPWGHLTIRRWTHDEGRIKLTVMARPLRIEKVGEWYHVTARGNERKAIFRDDADREGLEPSPWEAVIAAVGRVKGETWDEFRDRHGHRGRDLVL